MAKLAAVASPGRVSLAVALGTSIVVAAGAVIGFAVQKATGPHLGDVERAVVSIDADLGGRRTGLATGMIITSSGEVLTNRHVINGALGLRVRVPGIDAAFAAAVLGIDPSDDIAVLQLQDAANLPTVHLDDQSGLSVGERVTAIGRADGSTSSSVERRGAIAALGKTVVTVDPQGANPRTLAGLIQFSAPVAATDCGGPLLDTSGSVIGMSTASADQVRPVPASSTTGFAIPITAAMPVVHDIEAGTPNPRVLGGQAVVLGVSVVDSTRPPGARVDGVEPLSPAQAAGITADDVIVGLDAVRVGSSMALRNAIHGHRAGDIVTVTWLDPFGQSHRATARLATGTL